MSRFGQMEQWYTKGGLPRYELKIYHDELNKFQVMKGDNEYVVTQKAQMKMNDWDEMWNKKLAIQKKSENLLDKKQSAIEKMQIAQKELWYLAKILAHTLKIDDAIDWESLKNYSDYGRPKPSKPVIPRKPLPTDITYQVKLSFWDRIFSSRRFAKEYQAEAQFKKDFEEFKQTAISAATLYKKQVIVWAKERERYLSEREKSNQEIEVKKRKYLASDLDAITDYCEMVLNNSEYPDYFPKTFELEYNPQNKIIIVDYDLPTPNDLPTLQEVKYIASKNEYTEKHIKKSNVDELYDGLIYQIALRTIHELYEADKINALESIVFNGLVKSIDPATGQNIRACIISLQISKGEFETINLQNVDPKACFRKFKGIGSSQLHSLTPVAPLLVMNKDDARFVASYAVIDGLQQGQNLAAMNWEDFEHLIRELFEKEFSAAGGEVKVTRASKDGGIDAVIFDPDPIRGGKIVIQAKRYTNTVGVSAVRDLYGTLMNEGANKGILVTTSDYGPDAYDFAKDKPITLLSGGNLLHLLQKHGYGARIDLAEAKKIIAEENKI